MGCFLCDGEGCVACDPAEAAKAMGFTIPVAVSRPTSRVTQQIQTAGRVSRTPERAEIASPPSAIARETAQVAATKALVPRSSPGVYPQAVPLSRPVRTFDAKGRFESHLSNDEAEAILKRVNAKFARELLAKKRQYHSWTGPQLAWVHRLALEQLARENPVAGALGMTTSPLTPKAFPKVYAMVFGNHQLQQPSVTLWVTGLYGQMVDLTAATPGSQYTGTLWLSNGETRMSGRNVFYGSLAKDTGLLWLTGGLTSEIQTMLIEVLTQFESDPEGYIRTVGKRAGHCCFCRRPLEDRVSTALGYGPVCASHRGLSHSEDYACSLGLMS